MKNFTDKLVKLNDALQIVKSNFLKRSKELGSSIHIYTHLDADGLSSGAIIGKALFREDIPFQITVLRQLENEEIIKISENLKNSEGFLFFSDFGSGQYIELQKQLIKKENFNSFIILDHHLPQKISSKEDIDLIKEIHNNSNQWHINPYFFGVDGSLEISGAGLCYLFAKSLNKKNIDLSPIALVGAIGDIQNQGPNNSFLGINSIILEESKSIGLIEVKNDLNFSSIKPLNEAIAYSKEIYMPGLTGDANRTLIFLQTLGILMEDSNGNIRTLSKLNQDEKQKITTAIIEYVSTKLDVEPSEIIKKLIVNRYLLKSEVSRTELHDLADFSNLLNACGRTNSASLGIAIAMGDRKKAFQESQEIQKNYKKLLLNSLTWLQDNQKIQHMDYIQYFFGNDVIPERIVGTIASMLVFENFEGFDKSKPIFGLAKRKNENVYKVSGRAHEEIVSQGVNLSQAIREACELSKVDVLGGGHPPAAGTKIPIDKAHVFLENCNQIIKNQLNS